MKSSPTPRFLSSCTALALFPLLAAFAHAGTYTWISPFVTSPFLNTWDTTTANWNDTVTNPTTWVNGTGNDAVFNGPAAATNVTLNTNIVANSITTNVGAGSATISITGGAFSIDVSSITTNTVFIDLFSKITGNHGLTVANSGSGRLNIKTVSDYTGDTTLVGAAYINTDNVLNALPTTTTLNMGAGASTFRFGKTGVGANAQELTGLTGTSATQSVTLNTGATTADATLTITTKSGVTTAYAGRLEDSGASNTLNLVIKGLGTQTLSGNNLFNGSTTVSGGTLMLGSNLGDATAANSTRSVTVNGGVLTSSITNVNLGVGGVSISAGEINIRGSAAAGTFTLAANQVFSSTGGKLTFNIGTGLDQIKGSGTGTFSIGSGTEIALITGAGFSYANTYSLLNGFASGSVASTGVTITGYDTANYIASLSSAGVLSFSASAVPEPSTYALLGGMAALGFVVIRRRLAKKA